MNCKQQVTNSWSSGEAQSSAADKQGGSDAKGQEAQCNGRVLRLGAPQSLSEGDDAHDDKTGSGSKRAVTPPAPSQDATTRRATKNILFTKLQEYKKAACSEAHAGAAGHDLDGHWQRARLNGCTERGQVCPASTCWRGDRGHSRRSFSAAMTLSSGPLCSLTCHGRRAKEKLT
eukprot:886709-Pleurochrysis_carterae.AAC.4